MDSKWLFQNHRANEGELCFLQNVLEQQKHVDKRNFSLESSQVNTCNKPGCLEKGICHQHDCSMNINKELEIDISMQENIIHRWQQCKYIQLLYDSVLLSLTDSERWIVETHFVAGWSITETLDMIPKEMTISSRSSLIRHINKLLKKSNSFLDDIHASSKASVENYTSLKCNHD